MAGSYYLGFRRNKLRGVDRIRVSRSVSGGCEQVSVWRRASVRLSSTVGSYVMSCAADRLLAYHVRRCPVELVDDG